MVFGRQECHHGRRKDDQEVCDFKETLRLGASKHRQPQRHRLPTALDSIEDANASVAIVPGSPIAIHIMKGDRPCNRP